MTRTFNWKIVVQTLGALLQILALFMVVPTLVSYFYNECDTGAFITSTLVTFIVSCICLHAGRHASKRVGEREGYLIVGLIWFVFAIFGALPFYLSGSLNFTDSYFESMAGFSTFGGTVYSDVEAQTHGILFWRSLMQWLGGMGIIVLSIAVLPMFGLGGMQLYAAEVTGVSYEKLGPRISGTAKGMWGMYIALTLSEFALLYFCGMDSFDSVCHSMATIATGGFSTQNLSIMEYSPAIQWIIAVFMLLSGINFTLLIFIFRGKPLRLWRDEETRWYIIATLIFTFILAMGLFVHYGFVEPDTALHNSHDYLMHGERALRKAFFMVTSAVTSTGFAASDYMTWPKMWWGLVFFLMLLGGCAGSTAGGFKQVRIILLFKNGLAECQRRIHPNAIIPAKLNGKPVEQQTINNIMAFTFFYLFITVISMLIFSAAGLPFDEAIGTAFSAINNVGISIGNYGPSGSYADFPIIAKWWATFVMVVGRLEIFTVLLLFSPALWRK
ncbi:MAG: TrkH family potassium uptake protein [Paludibacteraceae bacterium]|nr:TrkH family potassium uptake protein [Paludibacteraceae bacterium]